MIVTTVAITNVGISVLALVTGVIVAPSACAGSALPPVTAALMSPVQGDGMVLHVPGVRSSISASHVTEDVTLIMKLARF